MIDFWNEIQDRTPQLSLITGRYLSIPVNSVDAESSFNAYKNVVNVKRHSLTDNNTKYLVRLYYNSAMLNQDNVS